MGGPTDAWMMEEWMDFVLGGLNILKEVVNLCRPGVTLPAGGITTPFGPAVHVLCHV